MDPVYVSSECLDDVSDLLAHVKRLQLQAFIEREITALAGVTSEEFARWVYRPTAFECY